MKIEIDNNGSLFIERGKVMKLQSCPRMVNSETTVRCGDWCPRFGEPEEYMNTKSRTMEISLRLCDMTHLETEKENFIDKRMV